MKNNSFKSNFYYQIIPYLIRTLLVVLPFFIFQLSVQGQNQPKTITLKGQVTDTQGEPIIQAALIEVGTKNGTVTDVNGNFTIQVRKGAVLQVSFLGYQQQNVKTANKGDFIKIVLEEDAKSLDEVLVIGYGKTKRSEFTGAANVVDMDAMRKTPVGTFAEGLAGRAAGVQVSSEDGQPGVESDIVIRGASSMTQSNSPLYVVDEVPIDDFDQSAINPNDIESMTILKDASSTSIYGNRGTNGVIVITTKKGSEGRPEITYNGSIGISNVTKRMEVMTPYQYLEYHLERDPRYVNTYYFYDGKTLDDYKDAEHIDFQDQLFRTATIHNHSLSLRGGTKATKYRVSLSAHNLAGVIINTGKNTYTGRLSLDQTVNSKLKVGLTASYSDNENYGPPVASATLGERPMTVSDYLLITTWGYRPVAGKDSTDFYEEDFDPLFESLRVNPIKNLKNAYRKREVVTFSSNLYANYEIIKNLTLNVRGRITRMRSLDESFSNSKTTGGRLSTRNTRGVNAIMGTTQALSLNNENTLNYRTTINRVHNIRALLGYSIGKGQSTRYGFRSVRIPVEELGMAGMNTGTIIDPVVSPTKNTSMSYFGRVNYSYKGRYVFSSTFRRDGSSRFSKKNRWGNFPSASFAWNIKNEPFMRSFRALTIARLRFSFGLTGNNRVSDFGYYPGMLVTSINPAYSFNNETPTEGMYMNSMGNYDLKWESTYQKDLGLDLGFLKNRIRITVDLYEKTTKDLLMNVNMPATAPAKRVYMNTGSIVNRGLEFELKSVNIKNRYFTWESDFNISHNNNKVIKLMHNQTFYPSVVSFYSRYNMPAYMTEEGKEIGQFWGFIHDGNYQFEDFDNPEEGVYILKDNVPTNGSGVIRENIKPGDIKYKDLDGDLEMTDADRTYLGSPFPLFIGGLSNDLTYKNLNLNFFFQWSYGNKILNANRLLLEGNAINFESFNQFASYVDRWTPENPTNKNHRAGGAGPVAYSSRVIEDGSFLRLKSVALGYSLPTKRIKKIGIDDLQIIVSANNLFTWTNYSGLDPEVSVRRSILTQGYDYASYPRSRVISFGVNMKL